MLILTAYDNDEYIVEAVQSGASGYLLKTIEGPELARKIRSVFFSGRQEFPDHVRQLMPQYEARRRREAEEDKLVSTLSSSEIEALALIDRGLSYKEVARQLNKSRETIKSSSRVPGTSSTSARVRKLRYLPAEQAVSEIMFSGETPQTRQSLLRCYRPTWREYGRRR